MSHRLQRLGELIRAEVADLLVRGIRDPRVTGLVTVTSVEVANDLGLARVFVSVLGTEEQQVQALKGLQSARSYVRREIARRLKLRKAPDVQFTLDRSIERGARVLALMRELGLDAGEGEPSDETRDDPQSGGD